MYRRPPTAATAWATDSSIGAPTEAWPGERQGSVQKESGQETHTETSNVPVREGTPAGKTCGKQRQTETAAQGERGQARRGLRHR